MRRGLNSKAVLRGYLIDFPRLRRLRPLKLAGALVDLGSGSGGSFGSVSWLSKPAMIRSRIALSISGSVSIG